MEVKFRTLKASEIEVRVGTASEKGVSLLLYKDARVDMNLLDETVGPMNWQRYHSRENANCTIAIWDAQKSQWVAKEDTGTESNTEAEKGLASDSFKRAGVNWGIGRELYTAPFIWVGAGNGCEVKPKQNGKGFDCRDKFVVIDIDYNERREISVLAIKNAKTGVVVFSMGKSAPAAKRPVKREKTAPQPTKEPANTFIPRCADCNEEISIRQHDDTVKAHKRPLCPDCVKAQGSSAPESPQLPRCEKCGCDIKPYISPKNGKTVTAEAHAARSMAVYKGVLCLKCIEEKEAALRRVEDYGRQLAGEAR